MSLQIFLCFFLYRMLQGMGRAEITSLIVKTLNARQLGLQKFHGRRLKPLSRYAKNVLQTKRYIKWIMRDIYLISIRVHYTPVKHLISDSLVRSVPIAIVEDCI